MESTVLLGRYCSYLVRIGSSFVFIIQKRPDRNIVSRAIHKVWVALRKNLTPKTIVRLKNADVKLHQRHYFSVIPSLPGSSPSSAMIMKSCTSHAVKAGCTSDFPFPGLMPFPRMPVEDVVPLADRSSNSFVFCGPATRGRSRFKTVKLGLILRYLLSQEKKYWIRPTKEW